MAAGDKAYWSDVANAINPPLVRLVQQAGQSIPDATQTALTFGAGSEDIDTHGFHDTVTNNTRITPNVAGYYEFRGVYYTGAPTTPVSIDASFRKNGSTSIPSGERVNSGAIATGVMATCTQPMNGSTDYMEFMAFQDSSGAVNTNVSARFTSYVECEYIRPL
jgi:hypothetical protein